ncbi:MAG: insulinase family protein, partial [Hyphomicrobium sp.]|nr:insulinase family protein [Hyphomicrobium sp.]
MKLPAISCGDPDTRGVALPNGVRVVVMRLPHLATAAVSVFVKSGSEHESARENGISHFIEHMAFKGTRTRDCQRINLDAERLGAEVNAHTDRDHTAFHMRGHARDAAAFVRMLGDIVREGTFPEAELERERSVILHE